MHSVVAETAGAAVGSLSTLIGTAVERRWSERRLRAQAAELARQEQQRKLEDAVRQIMKRLDHMEATS